MTSPDTIYALASGRPPCAIAVMRISGPAAGSLLDRLCGRRPIARRASLRALRDEDGALLDRAMVLWLPGPRTATGEDVAELHLHGGRAVIDAVERALARQPGLRRADPGEFTRRALANGIIDLTEAEGLADLIAAETEAARRQALAAAQGSVRADADAIGAMLLALAARLEAAIEYGEDEADVDAAFDHRGAAAAIAREVRERLERPATERLRDGVRIVIAGPPNAGKSTLFNRLVGREAAIVSDRPGTTRDVIELAVSLEGVPVLLADIAGLRETADPIEAAGVARAGRAIGDADLVLWLGREKDAPAGAMVVAAKADLLPISAPGAALRVSAKTGEGLSALRCSIISRCRAMLPRLDEVTYNARQRALLSTLGAALEEASGLADPLLAAALVHAARCELDRLTGRHGIDDMLDALFSSMCIGK